MAFYTEKIFLSVKCILQEEGEERGATPAPPCCIHARARATSD